MKRAGGRAKGFTMIEIIAALAIVSILAAVSVPSLLGFLESGRQINRDAIARTLYLAAQNRLTEMRVTKTLKAELYNYGFDTDSPTSGSLNSILSGSFPILDDAGNVIETGADIYSFSKPSGNDTDNFVTHLLDPLILDKEILNDAILIEFNIKTGVVLSVFYSDTLETGSFTYGSSSYPDERDLVAGERPYTEASNRKQGYYGVNQTGELPEDMRMVASLYDSSQIPLPDDITNNNVLYAQFTIPRDPGDTLLGDVFELRINDNLAMSTTVTIDDFLPQTFDTAISLPLPDGSRVYQDRDSAAEAIILYWILDYVHGDMRSPVSTGIGTMYGDFDPTKNITVSIEASNGAWARSLEAHPYQIVTGPGRYEVASARHLYNIRYNNTAKFTQTSDITLASVTSFDPIRGLTDICTYNGNGKTIRNLTVDASTSEGLGLFSSVSGSVTSLTLENFNITGQSNVGIGALCGEVKSSGTLTNIQVINSTIEGQGSVGNVGGVTGQSSGTFTNIQIVDSTVSGQGGNVGGIVGAQSGGSLENIRVGNATVAGLDSVGGVAGQSSGMLKGIQASNTSISGQGNVGGIVGAQSGGTLENIRIGNATVTGLSSNVGGVAGQSSGMLKDIQASNTSISGQDNVGGVVGDLSGNLSLALVVYDVAKTIQGTSNVGGIAGRVGDNASNGSVTDTTFVSSTDAMHISGSATSIGGIAGFCGASGTLSRSQFLALAPEYPAGTIRPIVGDPDVSRSTPISPDETKLVYLCGTGIDERPAVMPYNTLSTNGIGTGLDTINIRHTAPWSTDWKTLPITGSVDVVVIDPTNDNYPDIYPYPYLNGMASALTPLSTFKWPIAAGGGKIDGMAYYEVYDNGGSTSYGLWTYGGIDTLNDTLKITEAGYVALAKEALTGTHVLYARDGSNTNEWQDFEKIGRLSEATASSFAQEILDEANRVISVGYSAVYMLPLADLVARAETLCQPLALMHTASGPTNPNEIRNVYLQPMFARGLFGTPTADEYTVRTPWQMRNIDTMVGVGNGSGSNMTLNMTFTQERDLDFRHPGIGVGDAAEASASLSSLTDGVVRGTASNTSFVGTYDGGNFEISNVTVNGTNGVGLFQTSFGRIHNLTLQNIIASGSDNVGALCGQSSGTLTNITVKNASVTGLGGSIGGVAGQSGGTLTIIEISGSTVTGSGDNVGGISGQSSGVHNGIQVSNTTVNGRDNTGGAFGQASGTSGTVNSVQVSNTTVNGRDSTGGVFGQSSVSLTNITVLPNTTVTGLSNNTGGVAGQSSGTLTNIQVTNASVTGLNNTGGAVGLSSGTVTSITVSGAIVNGSGNDTGGVFGVLSGTAQTITANNAIVNGSGNNTGGVAGLSSGAVQTVTAVNVTVTGLSNNTGGVIGVSSGAVNTVVVSNTAVNGLNNTGGATGLSSGTLTNVQVSDTTVTGQSNVGGSVGDLSGALSQALVQYRDSARGIQGITSVGGLVGLVRSGGSVADTTFVSAAASSQITLRSGTATSIGGIVGSCGTNGTINRSQYLALAPVDSAGTICPIVGDNFATLNNNTLVYLCGTGTRPAVPQYNTQSTNGIGMGLRTFDIHQFNITAWNVWSVLAVPNLPGRTLEETVTALNNETYPYPHLIGTINELTPLTKFEWPITVGGGAINNIAYYERYEDSTYGLWYFGSDNGLLDNAKTITEAGYVVLLDTALVGNHDLYARDGGVIGEWTAGDRIGALTRENNVTSAFARGILTAVGRNPDNDTQSAVYRLPLAALVNRANALCRPLRLMHTATGPANATLIDGFIQPMFAKGLYETSTADRYVVRTPWQMRNIDMMVGVDNNGTLISGRTNVTGGVTYVQERNLDFTHTGTGVGDAVTSGSLTGGVVRGGVAPGLSFEGRYYGGKFEIMNVVVSGTNTVGLFQTNRGRIESLTVRDITLYGQERKGSIAGENYGVISACSAANVVLSNNSTNEIGAIAGVNAAGATIEKCNVAGFNPAGNVNGSRLGGIVGRNNGTIELCTVSESGIEGTNNIGGIAGVNAAGASILQSGVQYSTVKGTGETGGIAGVNAGLVQDVYFLSAEEIDSVPVGPKSSGNGDDFGGIVCDNTGGVISRAFYLAPAPHSGNGNNAVYYPIARRGDAAETIEVIIDGVTKQQDTCFFLTGSRYTLDYGNTWIEKAYNPVTYVNGKPTNTGGGGMGLLTRFMKKSWIEYAYGLSAYNVWYQPSRGFVYPMVIGVTAPAAWPETESPVRPDQEKRLAWDVTELNIGRANNLNFLNGDFEQTLLNPNAPYNEINFITQSQITAAPSGQNIPAVGFYAGDPPSPAAKNGSDYYGMYIYYDSRWVRGWDTRPVNTANYSNQYWNMIEFQRPYNSTLAGSGRYGRMRTNYNGGLTGAYIELNADVPGTLYQICDTKPGSEMFYSFYHARRNAGNETGGVQRMNFYLSGMYNDNGWKYTDTSGRPTIIRPCITPRGTALSNTNTRHTVVYGTTGTDASETVTIAMVSFYDPNRYGIGRGGTRTAYLYDVWVSGEAANSTAQPTSSASGYGVTFWSNTRYDIGTATNQISQYGVKNLTTAKSSASGTAAGQFYLPSALLADAQNNVIGYWDVKQFSTGSYSEWKQYYGLYTIPEGQTSTEFAYESASTRNEKEGNYLDGITFKSPAFLSVEKSFRKNGASVSFVKPNDPLTVELLVTNYGEVEAGSIKLTDQLTPYTEYIDLVSTTATVKKGAASTTATIVNSGGTLTIDLAGQTLKTNESLTVSFDIKVRDYVRKTTAPDYGGQVETLLYYFENQAMASYSSTEFRGYAGLVKKNASGEALKVSIDPVRLDKTITAYNGDGSVNANRIGRIFDITLTVENALDSEPVITRGLISDIIPEDFELVGPVTDGNGNELVGVVSVEPDNTNHIVIQNVNLGGTVTELTYHYTLEYVGKDYGLTYTSITSDYRYLYQEEGAPMPLSVLLQFPKKHKLVGISAPSQGLGFTVTDTELTNQKPTDPNAKPGKNYDLWANYSALTLLAEGNPNFTQELILCDKWGNPVQKNASDNYRFDGYAEGGGAAFTAELLKSEKKLLFTPEKVGGIYQRGDYVLYYKFSLVGTVDGEAFDLSSPPAKIVITLGAEPCAVCGGLWNSARLDYDHETCGVCGITCDGTDYHETCGVCGAKCDGTDYHKTCSVCGETCDGTDYHKTCSVCGVTCDGADYEHETCGVCGETCDGTDYHAICEVCEATCDGIHYEHTVCVVCGAVCDGTICTHDAASGTSLPSDGQTGAAEQADVFLNPAGLFLLAGLPVRLVGRRERLKAKKGGRYAKKS